MNKKIAFLGDSLTQGGRWAEYFSNPNISNHGVCGEKSDEIISRTAEVLSGNFERIFVLMGINDLGDGRSVDSVIENYKILLRSLREAGNIEVVVQSVLPVNFNLFTNPRLSKVKILELNGRLEDLSALENVPYLDLYPLFATYDDELINEYTYDGLHLNVAGYRIWKNCLINACCV